MTSPSNRQRGSRGFVIWLGSGLLAASITAITSFLLGGSVQAPMAPAKVTPHDANREPSPEDRVLLARRDGIRGLDAFIEHQRRLVAGSSEPDATGYALTILAMALGERCSARNAGRGIQVGRPLYEQVPEPTERDITEGLDALDRAQELGFESSELHRIRSLLLSCRVVGLTSALRWKGQIGRELQRAFELDPNNPRAHVGQGATEILTPAFLGQDCTSALNRLIPAAEALPLDERPLVFAAMAAFLLGKRGQSLDLLDRATERRPSARFAAVVAERIRRGEKEPFAGDVPADYAK